MILVDPRYNPDLQSGISSATHLAPGVTIAKFLGAPGNPCVIDDLLDDEKLTIARHLYLHAEAMRMINENMEEFKDVTLNVLEGVYRESRFYSESLTRISKEKVTGRTIIYEVTGKDGLSDPEKSFDVAEYWKDYLQFDEVSLDYDLYNPSGKLHVCIILTMPFVNQSWDPNFEKRVNTYFNGILYKTNELVELIPVDSESAESVAPTSNSVSDNIVSKTISTVYRFLKSRLY